APTTRPSSDRPARVPPAGIHAAVFFFSSRRRHTRSVSAFLLNRLPISAFLLNRSSDLFISKRRISGMALLILALLQRIFLMSSLMLLLVWLIFFMVLIKLLPILGTISGKTVKLMVLALICLGNNRQD